MLIIRANELSTECRMKELGRPWEGGPGRPALCSLESPHPWCPKCPAHQGLLQGPLQA